MLDHSLHIRSEQLAAELAEAFAANPSENTTRVQLTRTSGSLAMEHWAATLGLLSTGLVSSAAVVHRAQYEAVLRSVWIRYAATDVQLEKLTPDVTMLSAAAAQNMPQAGDMTKAIDLTAPVPLASALAGFRGNSWKALNSYAHAGLHPIHHHEVGYAEFLFDAMAKNANGLAMLCAMHVASLTEHEPFMQHIHSLQFAYSECFAPK